MSPVVLDQSTQFDERHVQAVTSGTNLSEQRPHDGHVNDVGYLPLTAMSGVDVGGNDGIKSHFPASLTLELLTLQSSNPGVSRASNSSNKAHSTEPWTVATRELAAKLRDIEISPVLDTLYCWSMESFLARKQWFLPQTISNFLVSLQTTPELDLICESLPLLAALAWTLPRLRNYDEDVLVRRLTDLVQIVNLTVILEESDIDQLKCLVAQAILAMYYPSASSAWHLIGLAVTKAISGGLHHRTDSENDDSDTDTQVELFWSIYILDRTLAFCFDRPFAIEENDITVLPSQVRSKSTDHKTQDITVSIRIWTIQYLQTLSSWRQNRNDDFETRFFTYDHWHKICQELMGQIVNHEQSNHSFLVAFIHKHKSQLAIRGLLQLYASGAQNHYDECALEVKTAITEEVVKLITRTQTYLTVHKGLLGFVDAYDLMAGIICYLCVKAESKETWSLNITDFKALVTVGEIIQDVSRRFHAISVFKDTVWTFLAALEDLDKVHSDFGLSKSVIQSFVSGLGQCEVPIPGILVEIMVATLRCRLDIRGYTH